MKKVRITNITDVIVSISEKSKKVIFYESGKKRFFLEVGDILYNPKYNGFHQLRKINPDNTLIISGCCNFIDDSKTTTCIYKVKVDYIMELKPVYKIHKFMEFNTMVNAWKSKNSLGNKYYLFYQDPCIIKCM